MRLLEADGRGNFRLTKFVRGAVPEYAILSHTWADDGDELTFKDITENTGSGKLGYRKLQFCQQQAEKDGLQYFWIDSCCIDKSSSAELSEAINCMFRWYQGAEKCYVYLPDIPELSQDTSNPSAELPWESALRRSRWFTRGWTLQELIAPRSVEFFSRDGKRLGDKQSLEQQLNEITAIPIHALRGEPLSHFSADERMSWAEKRATSFEEDKAYCLLGIFDVSMPAIYGEGGHRAFRRLQDEIDKYSKSHSLGRTLESMPIRFVSGEQARQPTHGLWIVPFERNPRFTGRESELAKVEDNLFVADRTAKVVVTGLGGVGKTQLIIELIYRTKEKRPDCTVIWVSATSTEMLNKAYNDLAKGLAIAGRDEKDADIKELVRLYLSTEEAGQWLFVFDNVDDMDMLFSEPAFGELGSVRTESRTKTHPKSRRLVDYLPKSRQGSIVFTTRDMKVAVRLAPTCIVAVPEMDAKGAEELLEKYLPNQDFVRNQDVAVLLQELTYLPLAIAQAAAYINQNVIAIADYMALLAEQEEDVIDLLSEEFEDDGRYRETKNPVATTWLISFEQIRKRDPLAAEYLSFMCCLDPKNIPQSLLPPGPSRKKEVDAIGTLTAYSFVVRRPADSAFDLHRLVHLAMRNWLRRENKLQQCIENAVVRLDDVFPDNGYENRSLWRTYLPHVRFLLESGFGKSGGEHRTDLTWRYGLCQYRDGKWDEAEKSFSQVMEAQKNTLGMQHPDTLRTMHNLAMAYRDKGCWAKAEELQVQVIDIRQRILGLEHPHTLIPMNQLVWTYRNQGRLKEAQELGEVVVRTSKKVLGADHADTRSGMNNLALTYVDQGWLEKAEKMLKQVMETNKRVLGVEHQDTLISMNNMAMTYRIQEQWEKAEELEKQVLGVKKRVLGPEHPSTLTGLNNLAFTWKAQGRDEEAIELMRECAVLRERVLGAGHPQTADSQKTLKSWQAGIW